MEEDVYLVRTLNSIYRLVRGDEKVIIIKIGDVVREKRSPITPGEKFVGDSAVLEISPSWKSGRLILFQGDKVILNTSQVISIEKIN